MHNFKFKVLITSNLPYWWLDSADYCVDTSIHVDIKEIKYANVDIKSKDQRRSENELTKDPFLSATKVSPNLNALFASIYFISESKIHWSGSVAYDGFLINHVVLLKPDMPWVVWALFDEGKTKAGIKVFLKNREPTIDDFTTGMGAYEKVGPGEKFEVKFALPRDRERPQFIYLSVKPLVVSTRELGFQLV